MKRMGKIIGSIFFAIIILFAIGIGYAYLPSLSNTTFPEADVLSFKTDPRLDDEALKVVTYNIGYASGLKNNQEPVTRKEVETNLKDMVHALLPLNADVICLQEVDFRAARTYDIDQLEYLAKELHLPYAAYVILWNKRYVPWPYWPPYRHFGRIVSGQAILSRYPITDQTLVRFEKPKENPFWYNWFYLEKIAQKITIAFKNKSIIVWNIHLEAFKEKTRALQMELLAREVTKNLREIVIVAGDFNSPSHFQKNTFPAEEEVELLTSEHYLHAFLKTTTLTSAEGKTPIYSSTSIRPRKKIDHIFYTDGLILKDAGNLTLTASDHLPIFAIFLIH